MRLRNLLASVCAFAAAPAAAFAGDLLVPRQYSTIEDALARAQAGDRIVVRGGHYRDVDVKRDDVTIVGRGATLAGYVWIDGSHVTLQGFLMRDGSSVIVTGADDAVVGNRPAGGARWAIEVQGGARVRIEGNRVSRGVLEVLNAPDAVVKSNRLVRTDALVTGDGGLVESNSAVHVYAGGAHMTVRGNRCDVIQAASDACTVEANAVSLRISVEGDAAIVGGNDVGSGVAVDGNAADVHDNVLGSGLRITGDDATVATNTVKAGTFGVAVRGNRAAVTGNVLHVGSMLIQLDPDVGDSYMTQCPGVAIAATEPGTVVADNDITHTRGTGIVLTVDGATVQGNTIHGISSSTSVTVTGSGNTIADNTIVQTGSQAQSGGGVAVTGDDNLVQTNHITGTASDGIAVGRGTGNALTGNVLDRTHGCGILVTDQARGTVVDDCTVTGCDLGIVNSSADTSITGSTMTRNRLADVLDLAGFQSFDGNEFGTLSHDAWLAPKR